MKEKFWNDLGDGGTIYYFNSSRVIRTSEVSNVTWSTIPGKDYRVITQIWFNNNKYSLDVRGKECKPILKANSCTYASLSKKALEVKRKEVINSEIKSLDNQISKLKDMKKKLRLLL